MTKVKNQRQKKAVAKVEWHGFSRRSENEPPVPEVAGVDFAPYQIWAKENLGFEFANPSLLVTALTHRSYVNEHKKSAKAHNERLEFLGDAVLELATTEFLFANYDFPEGILTSWRAALVRTESIRDAGDGLDYASLIRMSRGEKQGSEQAKLHIIANCFEALVGAIYLDKDFETAREFIAKHILINIDEILENGTWRDPKSHLQEVSQREDGETPDYRVLDEVGPDHEKIFTVGAFVKNVEMGRGEGPSKQIAQQEAARAALKTYKKRYWDAADAKKKLAKSSRI
jgi:ribonuclease-3